MLRIHQLTKTYANGVQALRGIDLEIGNGLFGLLGPNGAGKSTLMRTVAALQQPDSGTIELDGIDVAADPRALRARLGYLPQQFGVYPRIPAIDLLDHLAVLKGITDVRARREQVAALLQMTNLWEVRRRAASTFSGGMLQRFGIAQALLGDPRLIIVDEPTAGLDPEERNRFHNLLAEIGENVVVLLSTHIVEDVSDLCPRMAILAKGRVVAEGRPADLVNTLTGRLWGKRVARRSIDEERARHTVISTHLVAGETNIHVVADSKPDEGFEPLSPNLEDVYFSVLRDQAAVAC